MAKLSIQDVDVRGKRVLTRVDFNVPVDDLGRITDDRRIRMALPTIRNIIDRGGRLILMSHFGRPAESGFEPDYSLRVAADALANLLGKPVQFPSNDCIDPAAAAAVHALKPGEIILLENLRFHPGETANDPQFSARLASFGDVYCNDAFGAAHRAHASLVGVPRAMGAAPRAAGFLLLKESRYLSDVLVNPARPFCAVLGGAKVSDKLGAIRHLIDRVDTILIGGAMAYTFLHVLGRRMGASRVEKTKLEEARALIDLAAAERADLFFPTDHICGKSIAADTPIEIFTDHIEDAWMGLDLGPTSRERFAARISGAKTIVWNGPVGVFELPPFRVGTERVAHAIADATARGAVSVIGGGDTAAAVEQFNLADRFSHVSTGGGASLELLEGKTLPGLAVLSDA